jgi:hypothetical protein
MSEIKIISIIRSELGGKKTMEVISKYKKRQRLNFIISDEYFTEEYILNYLKSIPNNYE